MQITVFYDGDCPLCTKEVIRWKQASFDCDVDWFNISGHDDELRTRGIDPRQALLQLHTQTDDGRILVSIDSYALLLKQLKHWRWLGVIMSLPVIKPCLLTTYDWLTRLRLKKEGRWPGTSCSTDKQ